MAKQESSPLLAGVLLLPVCLVALVEATRPAPGAWMQVYQYAAGLVYLLRLPMLLGSVGLAALGFFTDRSTKSRVVYLLIIATAVAVNLYLNGRLRV